MHDKKFWCCHFFQIQVTLSQLCTPKCDKVSAGSVCINVPKKKQNLDANTFRRVSAGTHCHFGVRVIRRNGPFITSSGNRHDKLNCRVTVLGTCKHAVFPIHEFPRCASVHINDYMCVIVDKISLSLFSLFVWKDEHSSEIEGKYFLWNKHTC